MGASRRTLYTILMLYAAAGAALLLLGREPAPVAGERFRRIPLEIAEWTGRDLRMDEQAIDIIQPDRMVFRNYTDGERVVNFYLGYYVDIDKSDLAHSPIVCYQAQGWGIRQQDTAELVPRGADGTVRFRRLLIEKGDHREIVYFWYQTRGYATDSLGLMRARLLLDQLTGKGSFNCFIRLSMIVPRDAGLDQDGPMRAFVNDIYPYVHELFE